MKRLFFLFVILLSACNKNTLNDVNPLDPMLDDLNSVINSTINSTSFEEEYVQLVNDHRHQLGLEPLIYDSKLEEISQLHADHMASGEVPFGHDGFSSRCSESKESFPTGNLCGEIVSLGPTTPQRVFESWMSSSGHKAKIEEARYTHTGLGFKKNSAGKYYWTELFLEVR